jgi:hypothetical protein
VRAKRLDNQFLQLTLHRFERGASIVYDGGSDAVSKVRYRDSDLERKGRPKCLYGVTTRNTVRKEEASSELATLCALRNSLCDC